MKFCFAFSFRSYAVIKNNTRRNQFIMRYENKREIFIRKYHNNDLLFPSTPYALTEVSRR